MIARGRTPYNIRVVLRKDFSYHLARGASCGLASHGSGKQKMTVMDSRFDEGEQHHAIVDPERDIAGPVIISAHVDIPHRRHE